MKKLLFLLFLIILINIHVIGCVSDVEKRDVDIDLSELSMTMIQAEYQRIISNSEDYMGKTIKVYGSYYILPLDNAGNIAHYVIVVSGDECCQMGFEFKRDSSYIYPDDYPSQNTMIQVTGTLDKHEQFGASYIYIDADKFTVIS